jgi:hypothetical protein
MAIPSSGAVALSDIQTEFGGSNPISISEYYAAAGGVPASGEISISDFYGTSAITHTLTQGTYTSSNVEYNGKFGSTIGSVSPTTVNGYEIYFLMKRWDLADPETTSDFTIYLTGSSVPVDAFTTVEIFCDDATVISLDYSEATSGQLSNHRYWTWTPADFTTAEHASFVATFDGAGDVDLRFTI